MLLLLALGMGSMSRDYVFQPPPGSVDEFSRASKETRAWVID
jgi:hypothetical protein